MNRQEYNGYMKEYMKNYRKEHREEINARVRKWRKESAKYKTWITKNKESIRDKARIRIRNANDKFIEEARSIQEESMRLTGKI